MVVEIPALSQRTAMSGSATYRIAAGLVILLVLAGAYVWSQIEIELVRVRRSS